MNSDIPEKLLILFSAVSEGTISESQLSELNDILSTDKVACEYYLEYMNMCAVLKGGKAIDGEFNFDTGEFDSPSGDDPVKNDSNVSLRGVDLSGLNLDVDSEDSEKSKLMQLVLELERTSPAVEIPKEEPKQELIQKVERDFKWFPGRPSKRKIRTLLAMVASIMVAIGYLYFFAPENIDRPVVAKLADSIDAVWDNKLQTPDEFGDMVQSRYRIKKGFISVLFNDGAKVTVEAPAELSLNGSGDMELFSGRIYAIVPEKAHGFTVKADISKIVDLGTEFGVEVDNTGNTQLHVTKGRTLLFSGMFSGKNKQMEVAAGMAKKIYNDGFVKDIELAENKFLRRISNAFLLVENFNNLDRSIEVEKELRPNDPPYANWERIHNPVEVTGSDFTDQWCVATDVWGPSAPGMAAFGAASGDAAMSLRRNGSAMTSYDLPLVTGGYNTVTVSMDYGYRGTEGLIYKTDLVYSASGDFAVDPVVIHTFDSSTITPKVWYDGSFAIQNGQAGLGGVGTVVFTDTARIGLVYNDTTIDVANNIRNVFDNIKVTAEYIDSAVPVVDAGQDVTTWSDMPAE